jgi:hypothetical protein
MKDMEKTKYLKHYLSSSQKKNTTHQALPARYGGSRVGFGAVDTIQ